MDKYTIREKRQGKTKADIGQRLKKLRGYGWQTYLAFLKTLACNMPFQGLGIPLV